MELTEDWGWKEDQKKQPSLSKGFPKVRRRRRFALQKLMPTRIAEYYIELQRREGLQPIELVAEWDDIAADAISAGFRVGMAASAITKQEIPLRDGSTN
jgi:hypothetical protein